MKTKAVATNDLAKGYDVDKEGKYDHRWGVQNFSTPAKLPVIHIPSLEVLSEDRRHCRTVMGKSLTNLDLGRPVTLYPPKHYQKHFPYSGDLRGPLETDPSEVKPELNAHTSASDKRHHSRPIRV